MASASLSSSNTAHSGTERSHVRGAPVAPPSAGAGAASGASVARLERLGRISAGLLSNYGALLRLGRVTPDEADTSVEAA
jgi:hypothetical protein